MNTLTTAHGVCLDSNLDIIRHNGQEIHDREEGTEPPPELH